MSKSRTLYLDHAATSYPKPDAVGRAILGGMEKAGGNPGRGSHRLSLAAAREVYACRTCAAEMFGTTPERVIFTLNATHALNIAIKGIMCGGGHALCSDMEHNAVLRPVLKLAREGTISYDVFSTFPNDPTRTDAALCEAIERLIKPKTKMLR